MATGPLMLFGTTHWLKGNVIDIGKVPIIIWQNKL
jgi:hypothetical protein